MNRPYLFMSGEFRVTMPVVFENDSWSHTMSTSELIIDNGILRRAKIFTESLKGIILYADLDNKELERKNLQLIIDNSIPCWPNPKALIKMLDRHEVLQNSEIIDKRLFITHNEFKYFPFPFVVKTGNSHRGIGKFLVTNENELPFWEEIATIEPFYVGTSVRILIIGKKYYLYQYDNSNSWIKNSPGAEITVLDSKNIPKNTLEHAFRLKEKFGLDIVGCDYVVDQLGNFNFLEINQFSGLDVFDEEVLEAKSFLRLKMLEIEKGSNVICSPESY